MIAGNLLIFLMIAWTSFAQGAPIESSDVMLPAYSVDAVVCAEGQYKSYQFADYYMFELTEGPKIILPGKNLDEKVTSLISEVSSRQKSTADRYRKMYESRIELIKDAADMNFGEPDMSMYPNLPQNCTVERIGRMNYKLIASNQQNVPILFLDYRKWALMNDDSRAGILLKMFIANEVNVSDVNLRAIVQFVTSYSKKNIPITAVYSFFKAMNAVQDRFEIQGYVLESEDILNAGYTIETCNYGNLAKQAFRSIERSKKSRSKLIEFSTGKLVDSVTFNCDTGVASYVSYVYGGNYDPKAPDPNKVRDELVYNYKLLNSKDEYQYKGLSLDDKGYLNAATLLLEKNHDFIVRFKHEGEDFELILSNASEDDLLGSSSCFIRLNDGEQISSIESCSKIRISFKSTTNKKLPFTLSGEPTNDFQVYFFKNQISKIFSDLFIGELKTESLILGDDQLRKYKYGFYFEYDKAGGYKNKIELPKNPFIKAQKHVQNVGFVPFYLKDGSDVAIALSRFEIKTGQGPLQLEVPVNSMVDFSRGDTGKVDLITAYDHDMRLTLNDKLNFNDVSKISFYSDYSNKAQIQFNVRSNTRIEMMKNSYLNFSSECGLGFDLTEDKTYRLTSGCVAEDVKWPGNNGKISNLVVGHAYVFDKSGLVIVPEKKNRD